MALTLVLLEGVLIFVTVLGVVVLRLGPGEVGWTGAATIVGQAFGLAVGSVAIFHNSALNDPQAPAGFAQFASRLPRSFPAILVLLTVVYALLPGTGHSNEPFVSSLLWSAGIVVGLLLPLRAISSSVGASRLFRERILILGLTPLARRLIHEIETRPSSRRMVVGVIDDLPPAAHPPVGCPIVGPCCRVKEIVGELRPHSIVVALSERRGRTPVQALLESCVPRGVIVEDAEEFYESLTGKLAIESSMPSSTVFSRRFRPSRFQQAFARSLSLSAAIAGLVVLSPLLGLIALAIKLDSSGPVLSIHERVGAHGRPFELLKFRTLDLLPTQRSESAGGHCVRVTRVGKWLQALRLDGLPQLINVLRGEMNLVGPRPHSVCKFESLALVSGDLSEVTGTAIGYYALRAMVRPGLTGWAQLRFRFSNSLEVETEELRFDLYYVKDVSPWLDLRILLETLKLLISRRRHDGVTRADVTGVDAAGPSGLPPKVKRAGAA